MMKITDTDARDGKVIVVITDDHGRHEISLNTMDAASLIGALRVSIGEAIGHPVAYSTTLPGIERVQFVETPEEIYFRIFVNERIYHEYPVPKGTTMADELKLFADRAEARNWAKATNQPPDSPAGKH
jgi:hypothetical protein